jgi:PTH1 family peptidyl-tRNA hydrolase
MKLIVGLGNPGAQYEKTRHNAGFLVLDRLAARFAPGGVARARFSGATLDAEIASSRCLLLKPTTYMNVSGRAVGEAVRFFKLEPAEDLLVIVDDVALPAGQIRLRAEGGAGGHNGLADIQRALGTVAYPRLRVGIDPSPGFMDQADYVLGRFTEEQWLLVEPALDEATRATEIFVAEGVTAAMNRFNKRASQDDKRGKNDDAGDGGTPPVHPGWLGDKP